MKKAATRSSSPIPTGLTARPFSLDHPLLPLGLLALLIALSYGNSLGNGFAYDDDWIIVNNPVIRHLSEIPRLFALDYWGGSRDPNSGVEVMDLLYRPLTMATYALNHAVGGLNPVGYHLVNVLLHLLVAWLLYRLACQLGMSHGGAVVASALFAVHPIHTEAVTGTVGRAELLMSAGVLGSLLWAAQGRPALSMGAFVLALFSKEQAVVLPVLLPLYDLCRPGAPAIAPGSGHSPPRWQGAVLRYGGYVVPLIAYLVIRAAVLGGLPLPRTGFLLNPLASADLGPRLLTAVSVAGTYLRLCVWPDPLVAEYAFNAIPLVTSPLEPRFWLALLAWGGLVTVAAWSFRRDRRITWCVGLTLLTFLPTSNLLFPIGTIMGERLFYLPSAGLCLLVGLAWQRGIGAPSDAQGPGAGTIPAAGSASRSVGPAHVPEGLRLAVLAAVALLCTAFIIRTALRNRDWKDTETLHRSTIAAVPENARTQAALAELLAGRGEWSHAYDLYRASLRIFPRYPEISYAFSSNFGVVLRRLGKLEEAEASLKQAVSLNPQWSVPHINLGNVYFVTGRLAEAESEFKEAQAISPARPEPYGNLSLIRSVQGRYSDALELAEVALQRNRDYVPALYARALALEGLGRTEEAVAGYQQVVRQDPGHTLAAERLRGLPTHDTATESVQ